MPDTKHKTLAQIAQIATKEDILGAFCQFLDDYAHAEDKLAMISEEPTWRSDLGRWPYDFAACAHKLANDSDLDIPAWVLKLEYIAPEPYYAFNTENPDYQAYLRETTPKEYQLHNLYLGENVGKRA